MTTLTLSKPFRVLENEQEFLNAFRGVKKEDVIIFQMIVDSVSFQPKLAVCVLGEGEISSAKIVKECYILSLALKASISEKTLDELGWN